MCPEPARRAVLVSVWYRGRRGLPYLSASSPALPLSVRPPSLSSTLSRALPHSLSLASTSLLYMTVHGMMQHWQSSPHQQGSLTGGLASGPFAATEEAEAEEVEDVAEVVDGGMVDSCVR